MLNQEVQAAFETFFHENDLDHHKRVNEECDRVSYVIRMDTYGVVGTIDIQVSIMDDCVVSMVFYPFKIKENRLAEVNEFITRMNYEYLQFAKFELDYESGVLIAVSRHYTSSDNAFDEDMIESMLWEPALLLDSYGDDIFLIANGGISGKNQFLLVEKRPDHIPESDDSYDDHINSIELHQGELFRYVVKL